MARKAKKPVQDVRPKKAAFLAALAKYGSISAACRATGTGRQTHYDWLKADPDYAQGFADANEERIERLEAEADRRAKEGSDVLLIFLLKAARPSVYRERIDHRVNGEVVHVKRVILEDKSE